MDRRTLIRLGLATGASAFAGQFSFAAPAATQNRLVFIVMRGGLRPTDSKVGRAQIVRPPASAYVKSGSRGVYFIAIGVEGI